MVAGQECAGVAPNVLAFVQWYVNERPAGDVVAAHIPAQDVGPLATYSTKLPALTADALLDALCTAYPGAAEPYLAAVRVAAELPVERALVWAKRLRERGLAEQCPLLRLGADAQQPDSVRLLAYATAHAVFDEAAAVGPAAALVGRSAHPDEVLAELSPLAPTLCGLIGHQLRLPDLRINVGCGADRRDGYLNIDLRPQIADLVASAVQLPLPDGSVREVLALDLLEHFSEWQVPQVLAEWFRVLAPAGELVLRVPNLEVLARWLLDGSASRDDVIRNVYGGHRFGPDGLWDTHHTGWTPAMLSDQLARAGFLVSHNDGASNMLVRARRVGSTTRRYGPTGACPVLSVVIPIYGQAELVSRCLARLRTETRDVDYEIIVVDNGSTGDVGDVIEAAGRDSGWGQPIVVVTNEANLGFARACNQGARLAQAPVLVFLNSDTEVHAGWAEAILRVLDQRPQVGAVGGLLLYPNGTCQHAGVLLVKNPDGVTLDGAHRLVGLPADDPRLHRAVDLPAVSAACMAVRAAAFAAAGGFDEGYWNGNEDVDLCLALGARGWAVAYEPSVVVTHQESASGPQRWSRVQENRSRLSYRWGHVVSDAHQQEPLAPASLGAVRRPARQAVPAPRRGGVNLVGYLDAALGLGEVGRLMVESAHSVSLPVSTWSSQRHWSGPRPGFERRGLPFAWDTTLSVVNADQHVRVVDEIGVAAFRDRYSIGMWFWELEEPSPAMTQAGDLVHEVWAANSFIADAVKAAVGIPVTIMPVPVRAPAPVHVGREQVRMPPGFVFASAMDLNSVLERKNPLGLLSAFAAAFQPGEGPWLYLKVMNGVRYPGQMAHLRAAAADRGDVVLVDEVFTPEEAVAVPALADCYVSLHRSEGLGLSLMEAMAHGTPVVATGYSGNMDFMRADNSFPVPYALAGVPAGCSPYREGARWASPDLREAARILRKVWTQPAWAAEVGRRGQEELLASRSTAATGRLMKRRLAEIQKLRYGAARPRPAAR